MSEPLRGVVTGHGDLAKALVDAVERISGVTGVLAPVSNTDCDRERLASRISEASGQGPALVFTDLPSGSCMLAALTIARAKGEVRVVTGVNLAMLLDFVFHRELPPADAAARAAAAGEKAIRVS